MARTHGAMRRAGLAVTAVRGLAHEFRVSPDSGRILPPKHASRSDTRLHALTVPPQVSSADRLGVTILFAVLAHSIVILGVTFPPEDRHRHRVETLDVVLVPLRSETAPERSDYLAQADLAGGGDDPGKVRPATPLPSPVDSGEPAIAAVEPALPPVEPASAVAADGAATAPGTEFEPAGTRAPAPSNGTAPVRGAEAEARMRRALVIAALSAEIERDLRAYAERPRRKWISASTREHRFAAYMEAWRRKVEQVGNLNYPEEAERRGACRRSAPRCRDQAGRNGGANHPEAFVRRARPRRRRDPHRGRSPHRSRSSPRTSRRMWTSSTSSAPGSSTPAAPPRTVERSPAHHGSPAPHAMPNGRPERRPAHDRATTELVAASHPAIMTRMDLTNQFSHRDAEPRRSELPSDRDADVRTQRGRRDGHRHQPAARHQAHLGPRTVEHRADLGRRRARSGAPGRTGAARTRLRHPQSAGELGSRCSGSATISASRRRRTSSRRWPRGAGRNAWPSRSATPAGERASSSTSLQRNAWLSGPADSRVIFDTPYEERWDCAARLLGIDPHHLSSDAGHA